MKQLSEGKRSNTYSYMGSQLPHKTDVLGPSSNATRRGASGVEGLNFANMMQGYGQPPNMGTPMMGAPMAGGNVMMSGYPQAGQNQMSLPPQYSLQPSQAANGLQQGPVPNAQMYPSTMAMQSGATVVSPAQLAAFMKQNPGAVLQQQVPSWPQYGGMQGMNGYPMMSPYGADPNASSYIVDYSDGLNILDEPTGGTTYPTK